MYLIYNIITHIYHSFLDENVYFTQNVSAFSVRTCDNTTFPNIRGTDAWAVPQPQILRETVPPVPLRLRPWWNPPLGTLGILGITFERSEPSSKFVIVNV